MARRTNLLSDTKIRKLVSAGTPVAVSDGDGLTFTLSAAGLAVWVLRYRVAGRRRELTLGRYPDVTLQAARRRAAIERVRVSDGVDIAAEKRRSKHASAAAWTVRQLVEDFEAKALAKAAASTRKLYGGYLAKWVKPRLGAMLVRDVAPADIVALLRSVSTNGAGAMRTLHAVTRAAFEHARGQVIRADNPAIGIRRESIAPAPERRVGEALHGKALATFVRAIPDDVKGWAVHLHLLTGVRPGELCGAAWREFDLRHGTWTIPDERTKMGRGYVIQMPMQAVALLNEIKAASVASEYLFPASRGHDRPMPYQTYRAWLWRVLDAIDISREAFKPHDLRRTMRSGLASLSVRYEVAERAINHKLPGMAEIYDRNDYEGERAAALAQWANYVESLRNGVEMSPMKRTVDRSEVRGYGAKF